MAAAGVLSPRAAFAADNVLASSRVDDRLKRRHPLREGGSIPFVRTIADATGKPSHHYNGKVERPCIWAGPRAEDALASQRGATPRGTAG